MKAQEIAVITVATGILMLGACDKQNLHEYPNSRSDIVLINEYTSGGGAAGYAFGVLRLKTKESSNPIDIGSYAHVQTFAPKWVTPERLVLCLDGARYYLVRQLDLEDSATGARRTVVIDPACS